MNFLDLLLLVGVISCAVWGAKRGFIRMIMITLGLMGAIVIAVHYNDAFTRELSSYFRASPLWVTMVAFVLSSMIIFALFRLGAKLFWKVANLQKLGKTDQFGGALIGLIFGWIMMGYLVFLMVFMPLPYVVQTKIESSVFALRMGSSVPLLYESTEKLHPSQADFMTKMEDALQGAMLYSKAPKSQAGQRRRITAVDEARISDFLDRLDKYFVASS
jgi:uncharacterized membrane protein required for colicin V production